MSNRKLWLVVGATAVESSRQRLAAESGGGQQAAESTRLDGDCAPMTTIAGDRDSQQSASDAHSGGEAPRPRAPSTRQPLPASRRRRSTKKSGRPRERAAHRRLVGLWHSSRDRRALARQGARRVLPSPLVIVVVATRVVGRVDARSRCVCARVFSDCRRALYSSY